MSVSESKTATTCAKCFHEKDKHHDGVCMGDLSCQCFNYVEPFLFEFAQRVEQEKHTRKTINKRVKWILEELPTTRNAGEKSFYKIFLEIWFGFKIRKGNPQVMDTATWNRIPNAETVGRERRRVKSDHPELGTYDKEVLWHQKAIYQALLELSSEEN